jgi:CheY-like chemotaxis protein
MRIQSEEGRTVETQWRESMDSQIILVIEDNPVNMKLFRVLLKQERYEVMEAEDAETGIELAHRKSPHLILMDIGLPGLDGLNATRIIKKDSVLKDIPILALTAHAMSGDEEKAREAGCDGYMSKPIDIRAFLEMVSRHLALGEKKASALSSGRREAEGLDGDTSQRSEQNPADC